MEEPTKKKKKTDIMYLGASLIYFIMFFKGRHLLVESDLPMWLKVGISTLIILSFITLLFLSVLRIRKRDELERKIQLDALLIAFPLTVTLLFTFSQLELFIPFFRDDWTYLHVTAFAVVFYYVGLIIGRTKYF